MGEYICTSPEETFDLGTALGRSLSSGNIVLLNGGLGAGKTLFAKGILEALDFDIDEVTSPSFTLVNLYRTAEFDVYHIDLWRIPENANAAEAVGLEEILEDGKCFVIIEWAERLASWVNGRETIDISIVGEGDEPRTVTISGPRNILATNN